MSPDEADWLRFGLESDAAIATSLLLQGGDPDAYLASVNYTDRLNTWKASK